MNEKMHSVKVAWTKMLWFSVFFSYKTNT